MRLRQAIQRANRRQYSGGNTVAGAPTIGTATAGNGTVSITFTAPASNGGSAITGYIATLSTGATVTGASSPLIFTGVTPSVVVTVSVRAVNGVGTGAASAASNSVTPSANALRVVTAQNANAGAFQSNAAAQTYASYSHWTVANETTTLASLDYNWVSANNGETSATNAFTVVSREFQIGSISVPVTWSGATSKVINIDETDAVSDAIPASAFSMSTIPSGTIVYIKEIIDTGALNNKIPASGYDKRAYTAANAYFAGYNPANTTPSSTHTIGQFTYTGTTPPVVLNGSYRPMIVGTPVVDTPSVLGQGDSQVAGIGDVTTGGNWQYGIGVFQKATNYATSKLMPSINLGRAGNFVTSVIGTNTKWRPLMKYCNHAWIELGLNDVNTGGKSVSAQQADKLTLINLAKAQNMKIILSTMTPIATGTFVQADGSDQTASTPTANLNTMNAWTISLLGTSADYIVYYGDPVRNSTNSDKWIAGYTADGVHASPSGITAQLPNIKSVYASLV